MKNSSKYIMFPKHILWKKQPVPWGFVFTPYEAKFRPAFGRNGKDAREVYRDIANCRGCKNGMTPQYMCRMHRMQTERE